MEIRQLSASTPAQQPPAAPPKQADSPAVDAVQPPPKGGLPASQQVLSKLTPGDRAAIAGATGYHLSPTGAVTNATGAVPPWSFIMAFAASRTAQPAEESAQTQQAAAGDRSHVDTAA
ncbi:hypothetical protein [Dactylosporangium sp. CA-139066]|uniref:hypothetical protein n=1 Tax=Dactylosporangium sp. CA-139066 TaxID=3239930 RepID=UPI003D904564